MKRVNRLQQGTNGTGKLIPRYTEITLDSGVRLWVSPLNRYQLRALQDKADSELPFPDKASYEETISEEIAIGGRVVPAEQNPEYKKEYNRIAGLRSTYFVSKIRDLCIIFPDFPGLPGKVDLMNHFADYVRMQREFFGETMPLDTWEATWKFAILRSPEDETQIDLVARDQLPVTEVEISDAMRLFRPAIQWHQLRNMDALNKLAPRTGAALPNRTEPAVQRTERHEGLADDSARVVSSEPK